MTKGFNIFHIKELRSWEYFFSAQISTLAQEHLKNCSKKRPKKYSRLRVPLKALKKALKKVLNKQLSPDSAKKSTLKACSKKYSRSRVLKKVIHKSRDPCRKKWVAKKNKRQPNNRWSRDGQILANAGYTRCFKSAPNRVEGPHVKPVNIDFHFQPVSGFFSSKLCLSSLSHSSSLTDLNIKL